MMTQKESLSCGETGGQMSIWGVEWIDKRDRLPTAEDASRAGEVLVWHRKLGTLAAWWGIVAVSRYITHWTRLPGGPGKGRK